MKLRGEAGYVAETVTIDGVEFGVRELTTEEYGRYMAAVGAFNAAADKAFEGVNLPPLEPLTGEGGETLKEMQEREASVRAAAVLKQGGAQALVDLQAARAAVIDAAVGPGVATWTLAGHEDDCTPENAVLLPPKVKIRLTREILNATQFNYDEEDFAEASPRP